MSDFYHIKCNNRDELTHIVDMHIKKGYTWVSNIDKGYYNEYKYNDDIYTIYPIYLQISNNTLYLSYSRLSICIDYKYFIRKLKINKIF